MNSLSAPRAGPMQAFYYSSDEDMGIGSNTSNSSDDVNKKNHGFNSDIVLYTEQQQTTVGDSVSPEWSGRQCVDPNRRLARSRNRSELESVREKRSASLPPDVTSSARLRARLLGNGARGFGDIIKQLKETVASKDPSPLMNDDLGPGQSDVGHVSAVDHQTTVTEQYLDSGSQTADVANNQSNDATPQLADIPSKQSIDNCRQAADVTSRQPIENEIQQVTEIISHLSVEVEDKQSSDDPEDAHQHLTANVPGAAASDDQLFSDPIRLPPGDDSSNQQSTDERVLPYSDEASQDTQETSECTVTSDGDAIKGSCSNSTDSLSPVEEEPEDLNETLTRCEPGHPHPLQNYQTDNSSTSCRDDRCRKQHAVSHHWLDLACAPQYKMCPYLLSSHSMTKRRENGHFTVPRKHKRDHDCGSLEDLSGQDVADIVPENELNRSRGHQKQKATGMLDFTNARYTGIQPHSFHGQPVLGSAWPRCGRGGFFIRGRGLRSRGSLHYGKAAWGPVFNRSGRRRMHWSGMGKMTGWQAHAVGQDETGGRGSLRNQGDRTQNWNLRGAGIFSRGRTPYRGPKHSFSYHRYRSSPSIHMIPNCAHYSDRRHCGFSTDCKHYGHRDFNKNHRGHRFNFQRNNSCVCKCNAAAESAVTLEQSLENGQHCEHHATGQCDLQQSVRQEGRHSVYQNDSDKQSHDLATGRQNNGSPTTQQDGGLSTRSQHDESSVSKLGESHETEKKGEMQASIESDHRDKQKQDALCISKTSNEVERLLPLNQNVSGTPHDLHQPTGKAPKGDECPSTHHKNSAVQSSQQCQNRESLQALGQLDEPEKSKGSPIQPLETDDFGAPQQSGTSNTFQKLDRTQTFKRQNTRSQHADFQHHVRPHRQRWPARPTLKPDMKTPPWHKHQSPEQHNYKRYDESLAFQHYQGYGARQQDRHKENGGLLSRQKQERQYMEFMYKLIQLQLSSGQHVNEANGLLRALSEANQVSVSTPQTTDSRPSSLTGNSHVYNVNCKEFVPKLNRSQHHNGSVTDDQHPSDFSRSENFQEENGVQYPDKTDSGHIQVQHEAGQMENHMKHCSPNKSQPESQFNRKAYQEALHPHFPKQGHGHENKFQENWRVFHDGDVKRYSRPMNKIQNQSHSHSKHRNQQPWRKSQKEKRTQYIYFLDDQRRTNTKKRHLRDEVASLQYTNKVGYQHANQLSTYNMVNVNLQKNLLSNSRRTDAHKINQLSSPMKSQLSQNELQAVYLDSKYPSQGFANQYQLSANMQEKHKLKWQDSRRQQCSVNNGTPQTKQQPHFAEQKHALTGSNPYQPAYQEARVNNSMNLAPASNGQPMLPVFSNTGQPGSHQNGNMPTVLPMNTSMLAGSVNNSFLHSVNSPYLQPVQTPLLQPVHTPVIQSLNTPYPQQNVFQFPPPTPVITFGPPIHGSSPQPDVFQFPDVNGAQQVLHMDGQQPAVTPQEKRYGFAGNQPMVHFPPTPTRPNAITAPNLLPLQPQVDGAGPTSVSQVMQDPSGTAVFDQQGACGNMVA